MFPEEFIKRIHTQSYLDPDGLLKALGSESPVSVRINREKWGKIPRNIGQVPWCSEGYYLDNRPVYTLDPLFHAGCYYPQEASGMFLGEVFRQLGPQQSGLKVLDLCGAPGGKATHLSSLIGSKGMLVANEVIKSRAFILSENITKWGISNTIVTRNDPYAFGRLRGFFDMIVIDAPCSGEGMFRDKIAVDEWSVENASLCSDRQRRILMDAWPALKENGLLVYSTCTFNPDENEMNISWLVSKQKAESLQLDTGRFSGITAIEKDGIIGYGFYPGRIKGEGLFMAVLRKTEKEESHYRKNQKNKDIIINASERSVAQEWTHFDPGNLVRSGDNLFAVPCGINDYEFISSQLNILNPGTRICAGKKEKFLPSHELALSVFLKKDIFPVLDLDLPGSLAFLGRGNLNTVAGVKGWNQVRYRETGLGFVNNLGTRLNNYYPMEWRIRMNTAIREINDQIEWL